MVKVDILIKQGEEDLYYFDKAGFRRVKDLDGEQWRMIEDYPRYAISNMGRLKRYMILTKDKIGRNRILSEMLIKLQMNQQGYMTCTLSDKWKPRKEMRMQRLVAKAFIPNPNNYPFVNHLSEVKHDNRVVNLEWATPESNANWGTRNQRISLNNKNKKFTDEHKKNLSKSAMGNKNRLGHKNSEKHNEAISKKVYSTEGIFKSVKEASEFFEVSYRSMIRYLNGERSMPKKLKQYDIRYYEEGSKDE